MTRPRRARRTCSGSARLRAVAYSRSKTCLDIAPSVGDFVREVCRASRITPSSQTRVAPPANSQAQEMLDDPADLATHSVALILAQILDLLGDILAVEPVVGAASSAAPRPGTGSRHRNRRRSGVRRALASTLQNLARQHKQDRPASQSARVGSIFCSAGIRAARRVINV